MNKKNEDISLNAINKQITEMKKKILLFEGQRKAHYEIWDVEKKQNAEKIKQFKENIKQLYAELGKTVTIKRNVKICDKISSNIFLKRRNDETLELLNFKIIEARKKLDLLQHEINQKQQRIEELSTALSAKTRSSAFKRSLPNANTVSSLENQIHQVEINVMEAEHLRKKYRTIRSQLLDESVGFESTLQKLEEKINQQEIEITSLQHAHEEAIQLRNTTYEMLNEQEKNLNGTRKVREREIEQLRLKVENYKNDLERLERRMYPIKTSRPDSQSDTMELENTEVGQQSEYLKKIFDTLKEATGVTENEEVLKRFLSQKDTRTVLEKMKVISENEKQQLLIKKKEITIELETHKFADMKDFEKTEEELKMIESQIQIETETYEQLNEEYEIVEEKIKTIMKRIHKFCLEMKNFDIANVPEKCPSIEKCEWLLRLFQTKVESALKQHKEKSYKNERMKTVDLWTHLPYSLDPKISDVDEEEEIPTRNGLKREAQIIFENKNRRKAYRLNPGKQF